jgi:hypothetical protein
MALAMIAMLFSLPQSSSKIDFVEKKIKTTTEKILFFPI